jgi:hypothetical protein
LHTFEANYSQLAQRKRELQIPGSFTSLGSEGRELHLGDAADAGGESLSTDDFTFPFFTNDGKTMDGIVVLRTLPPETIAGDYTGNRPAAYRSFQWDVLESLAI